MDQSKDKNYELKTNELNRIFNNYKNEMKKTRQKIIYFRKSSKSMNRSRSSKNMYNILRYKNKEDNEN